MFWFAQGAWCQSSGSISQISATGGGILAQKYMLSIMLPNNISFVKAPIRWPVQNSPLVCFNKNSVCILLLQLGFGDRSWSHKCESTVASAILYHTKKTEQNECEAFAFSQKINIFLDPGKKLVLTSMRPKKKKKKGFKFKQHFWQNSRHAKVKL